MITVPQIDPVTTIADDDVIMITHSNGTTEKITGVNFKKAMKFDHNVVYKSFNKNLTGSTFPQEFYRERFPKGLYLVVVTFYIQSTSGFSYIDTHLNINTWYERSAFPAGWLKFTDVVELQQDDDLFIEAYGNFNQAGDSYQITNSSVIICCLKSY